MLASTRTLTLFAFSILFLLACKSEYSELHEFIEEYVEITESCTAELNKAKSAEEITKAANNCSPKFELWSVKRTVIKDKYFHRKNIPEEVKISFRKTKEVRKKFEECLEAKFRYAKEPYVIDALRRLAEAKRKTTK